jgi:flagellar protein FliO/FliZ
MSGFKRMSWVVGPGLAGAGLNALAAANAVALPATGSATGGSSSWVQAVLGLALVLGLILACGWAGRRFGLNKGSSGQRLRVVSSVMVGQRERVVVVEVGDQWLVLGVGPGQVRALHTLPASALADLPDLANPLKASPGVQLVPAFSQKLRESLGRLNTRAPQ